jgi:hypothetical protein
MEQCLKGRCNKNKKTASEMIRLFLCLGMIKIDKKRIFTFEEIDRIQFEARKICEGTKKPLRKE